jgi:hypothetical protein
MKKWEKIILPLFCLFLFAAFTHSYNKKVYNIDISTNKKLEVGEELTYVVSYSFIKLGEIKIIVKNEKTIKGKVYYSTIAYMDSYSGIPFVDLHMIYESTINSDFYTSFFRGIVKKENYSTFTNYYFKYDSSLIRIKKGKIEPYEIWTDSTTSADTEYQDGLSILYYARILSGSGDSVDVPCFVNEKKVYTSIYSSKEVSGISIDSLDYDVACQKLDGNMKFISVFGLTGNFEGWFSDDEASVPILAKLKVIIGSVKVELKSWKRPGWTPPKFEEN